MILLGDIGNTETKICIVNFKGKILKRFNLIKSPYIKGYPTTNLFELIKKKIDKNKFQNKLKSIFEKNLNRIIK